MTSPMTLVRYAVVLAFAGVTVVAPALPAAGDDPAPAACQGRTIPLEEDEHLVERVTYLHGAHRIGIVDGYTNSGALQMTPTAPTATEDKIYPSRASGVLGNPTFASNPFHGFWTYHVEAPLRVVCAEATIFAGTTSGALPLQLWVDVPASTNGRQPTRTATASGTATTVSPHKGNFGAFDLTAESTIVVQLNPAPPGALAYYDSVARPSSFTFVTLEKRPTAEPG